MKSEIPIFAILRSFIPAIRAAIASAHAARSKSSPGGKRITKAEWREIVGDALMAEADSIADKLHEAAG